MLAACVEASNGRDTPVQARSFVLVGDSSGYLHVLPLQYDTQFLTGSWKSQLKVCMLGWCISENLFLQPLMVRFFYFLSFTHHQVRAYPGGSSVTAVNVAEDRIYTAGGSIGTIKVWQPIFANERRQVVELKISPSDSALNDEATLLACVMACSVYVSIHLP